jgi:hypothetical protein
MSALWFWISLMALVGARAQESQYKFSDILSVIAEKKEALSRHQLFEMMGDSSYSYEKRVSFIPYLTHFAMTFPDMLDSWLYVPNPTNDLEFRINTYISEDNFHYNLFLNDIETVFGCTLDRFGSYPAVLRHIWGDENTAVRQLMYTWAATAKKYDDPLITLVTIESFEAGLNPLFDVPLRKIYMPEDGLKDMTYFSPLHLEFELNHTQTAWFKEEDVSSQALGNLNITADQWKHAIDVVDEIFRR